jgi:hypothetical protein
MKEEVESCIGSSSRMTQRLKVVSPHSICYTNKHMLYALFVRFGGAKCMIKKVIVALPSKTGTA